VHASALEISLRQEREGFVCVERRRGTFTQIERVKQKKRKKKKKREIDADTYTDTDTDKVRNGASDKARVYRSRVYKFRERTIERNKERKSENLEDALIVDLEDALIVDLYPTLISSTFTGRVLHLYIYIGLYICVYYICAISEEAI